LLDVDYQRTMHDAFLEMVGGVVGRMFGDPNEPNVFWICLRGKFVKADLKTYMGFSDTPCEWTLARTELGGGAYVSTVFLQRIFKLSGMTTRAAPFETMCFGLGDATYQWKYETQADALQGHEMAVHQMRLTQKAMQEPKYERRIKKWKKRILAFVRKARQRGPKWLWDNAAEAMMLIKTYSIFPALQDETQLVMMLLVIAREKLSAAGVIPRSSPEPPSPSI
jgi:hypothetical protein